MFTATQSVALVAPDRSYQVEATIVGGDAIPRLIAETDPGSAQEALRSI
jgi:hypothetical protein